MELVECYERGRDHGQTWTAQFETESLGMPNVQFVIAFYLTFIQFIQTTCATSGEGLFEGLEWLSKSLQKAHG